MGRICIWHFVKKGKISILFTTWTYIVLYLSVDFLSKSDDDFRRI